MDTDRFILACAMAEPTARAAAAVELPAGTDAPRELLLLPAGRIETRPHDSREAWHNTDAEAVVAASREMRSPLPIDYDHQTQFVPQNGQPAPAAGWIRNLFARGGEVWGEVEWTERGRQAVASREYRFISPTFLYEMASRKVKRIIGAGLTNSPAFFMEAIASAQRAESDMDLEKLRKALGLAKDATEEQILAAASAAAASHTAIAAAARAFGLEEGATADRVAAAATASASGMAAIAKAAGLERTARPETIATAVAVARAGSGDPDPARFVPRSEFDALSERLNGIETGTAEAKATAAVDDAVKAGKVTPAQRDWALGYARNDLAGFEAYAAATPVIVEPGPIVDSARPPGDPNADLNREELAVCRATGIEPEAFKASRKALMEEELLR